MRMLFVVVLTTGFLGCKGIELDSDPVKTSSVYAAQGDPAATFDVDGDKTDFVALRDDGGDYVLVGGTAFGGSHSFFLKPAPGPSTVTVDFKGTPPPGSHNLTVDWFQDDGDGVFDPLRDTLAGTRFVMFDVPDDGGGGDEGLDGLTDETRFISFTGFACDSTDGTALPGATVESRLGDTPVDATVCDAEGRYSLFGFCDDIWINGMRVPVVVKPRNGPRDLGCTSVPGTVPNSGVVPTANGKVSQDTVLAGDGFTFTFHAGDSVSDAADPTKITVKWVTLPGQHFPSPLPAVNIRTFYVDMDAGLDQGAHVAVEAPGLVGGIGADLWRWDAAVDWQQIAGADRNPMGFDVRFGLESSGFYSFGLSPPGRVTLSGLVVDGDGVPMGNCTVLTDRSGVVATTGRDGTFSAEVPVMLDDNAAPLPLEIRIVPQAASGRSPVDRTVTLSNDDLGNEVSLGSITLPGPAMVAVQIVAHDNLAPQGGLAVEFPFGSATTNAQGYATIFGGPLGNHAGTVGGSDLSFSALRDGDTIQLLSEAVRARGEFEISVTPIVVTEAAGRARITVGADVELTVRATGEKFGAKTNRAGVASFRGLPSLDVSTVVNYLVIGDGQLVTIGGIYDSEPTGGGVQTPCLRGVKRAQPSLPDVESVLHADNLPSSPDVVVKVLARKLFTKEFLPSSSFDGAGDAKVVGPNKRVAAFVVTETKPAPPDFTATVLTLQVVPQLSAEKPTVIDNAEAMPLDRPIVLDLPGFPAALEQYLSAHSGKRFNHEIFFDPNGGLRVPRPEAFVFAPEDVAFGIRIVAPGAIIAAAPAENLPDTVTAEAEMGPPAFTVEALADRIVLRFTPERTGTYMFAYEDQEASLTMVIEATAGVEVVREFPLPGAESVLNYQAELALVDIDDILDNVRTRLRTTSVTAAYLTVGGEGPVGFPDHRGVDREGLRERLLDLLDKGHGKHGKLDLVTTAREPGAYRRWVAYFTRASGNRG